MTGQANFLQSLGWAVVNSLWQLALLWVIYQLFISLFKKSSSSLKASLASGLLVGGFAWFIYTFVTSFIAGNKAVASLLFADSAGNEEINNWLLQTLPVASIIYLVLLLLPLFRFIRNYRYVQVIRQHGLTRIDVEWKMFVCRVASQMNISRTVKIWVSEFVSSPVTIGFLKPVILVPLAAINHLTPQQLEAVLLHELSHIKRFDYFINLIINFIQTVLYFNPFVKALVKIVEKEREKTCDEMVLQFQYDSHEYASALLKLEKANQEVMAIAAAGKKHDLLQRVELIMGVNRKPAFSYNRLAGLVAGIFCIIGLNALLMFTKTTNEGRAALSTLAYLPVPPAHAPDDHKEDIVLNIPEQPATVVNHIKEKTSALQQAAAFADYVSSAVNPEIINASLELANVPELKKYQEEQVKIALEASKKVLENVQWKAVEKSVADAFSTEEKEELKLRYEKQLEKFDWKKWENDLKIAYDHIDWENINSQLSLAVNQVRMDSIQYVYNKAISRLDGARKELSLSDLKGIPDTDITLKEIERKKADILRALNELKAARLKKVVHL